MGMASRFDLGRNLLCVAALAGVSLYWLSHAQSASDADRFTGASRALEAEGWRVSRRWFLQVELSRGDASETVWLEKVSDSEYAGR